VKNVPGSGDVAERTEVDEEVFVALDGRQRCRPGSTQGVVGRRRGWQVALGRCEVDPDVVVDGERHQLTVADELRGVVGGHGRRGDQVLEQVGVRERRGAEQVERRKVAEHADDVRQHHDHAASVMTRHPSTARVCAPSTGGKGGVQVALRGVECREVAHAGRRDDQPRADETERRYQSGTVHLPIESTDVISHQ